MNSAGDPFETLLLTKGGLIIILNNFHRQIQYEGQATHYRSPTEQTRNFIQHFFHNQIQYADDTTPSFMTILQSFTALVHQHAFNQLVLSGVDKNRLRETLAWIKRLCKRIIEIWEEYLSKMYNEIASHRRLPTKWGFEMFRDLTFMSFSNFACLGFTYHILNAIKTKEEAEHKLKSIFVSPLAFQTFLDLLEYCEVTLNGIPDLLKGRMGKLTGVLEAVRKKQRPKMLRARLSQKKLLAIVNEYLGTDFKDFSKRNKDYKPTFDIAVEFLERYRKW